ncbi:MAG TPA: plastocyanin/azurin family copper-binding protein [Candidatus Baltobacteraceae bacterium]|nr:plastocyanin/azurin family copper-binding protein [Candidatus Baltobacteraceae bacterium]
MVSMAKAIGGIVVIAIIIAAIGLVYGKTGGSSGAPYGGSAAVASSTVPASTTVAQISNSTSDANMTEDMIMNDAGSVTINVALSNSNNQFIITPNVITVSAGENVTLNVTNEGTSMAHNLMIPGLNVSTPLGMSPGQSAEVRFTAPSGAGNYTYYCSVGSHRQLGMVGTLVVSGS